MPARTDPLHSPRPHRPGPRLRCLLGVTGGIAAYKSLELVRLLHKAGWDVTAVMTRAARKFVGPESFRSLTGNPVALDLFPASRRTSRGIRNQESGFRTPTSRHRSVAHIDLATSADLVIVAPATANIIGKLASGIADDLLSTTLLAVPQPTVKSGRVIFAPAMNTNMWQNPVVQANLGRLRRLGYRFIAPGSGELACGTTGPGRMAEPADILAACRQAALRHRPSAVGRQPARGLRVLITAGRTEEPLDPVRVITNRSSGRMGTELARAFAQAGARVTLIAGAMDTPALDMTVLRWAQYQVGPAISGRVADPAVTFVRARTASAMHRAVTSRVPRTDILIMCAAVADYRPARTASGKHHADRLILTLQRTPDILKTVARMKHRALVVGFSLDDSLARARAKLRDKRLDLVVANPPETAGSDTIKPRLLFAGGRTRTLKSMPKTDFARLLVSVVCGLPRKKVR